MEKCFPALYSPEFAPGSVRPLAFKVDISAGGIDVISYYIALKKSTSVGKVHDPFELLHRHPLSRSSPPLKPLGFHHPADAFRHRPL
jgi:hypothetical protein